jgi:dihydrofolate reductase
MSARISIIAAIGKNRELGRKNELVWRIPEDLKRVKALTMGHPIIMGRKTYESIGRPLPGRTNIVVSRSTTAIEGCLVYDSFTKAIEGARAIENEEIFIFGGAQVYAEGIDMTDRLYLTVVDAENTEADTYFPPYDTFTKEIAREEHREHTPPYTWLTLERDATVRAGTIAATLHTALNLGSILP